MKIVQLDELAEKEDSPLSKVIYETMKKNQVLAKTLNRPSCQDTGVLQFWVKCGTSFPLIGELEALLKEAVVKATFEAPLRQNSVETFDEYNTGKNVGKGTPTVFWDIVPDSDKCEIYTYMAGGGCTLPGKAMVLDMYAHNGVLTAHTLRSKADRVNAVFQKFLHGSCALVLVVAS
jgi:L(+)-tartrate dehydratase alpha subunit